MSADEVVNVDRRSDGVSVVTLNRPSTLNAINTALLEGLVDALRALHDSGPIVVVGAGRAFCVGEDLKETLNPRTGGAEELRAAFEMLQDITRLMTSNPSPVVAAVNGFAVGGGAEIALAADLVVMSESARIRFPEVPIGHAHTGGISQRLPMLIGLLRAKELLMTGRWVDAAEAIRIGLVNESAPDALSRALEVAQELAGMPARSLAATKRSVEASAFDNMELTLRLEVEAALYCFNSSEAQATFAEFARTGTVAGER